jgi:hypothetical protein
MRGMLSMTFFLTTDNNQPQISPTARAFPLMYDKKYTMEKMRRGLNLLACSPSKPLPS